jgi:hypothetical protein
MNLEKEILKEHSKAQRDRIVRYVGHDAARFATLLELFLKGDYRVTQRASWPLGIVGEHHPTLLAPHLRKIITNLDKAGLPDAVKRNTIRMLLYSGIPKSLEGKLTDRCFTFLQDPKESIVVHVFAMMMLSRIVKKEPDLKNELRIIIEDKLQYGSPAFRSRGLKTLRELNS